MHRRQELCGRLFERHPISDGRPLRCEGTRELTDGLLEVRIVSRQPERGLIEPQRLIKLSETVMNFREAANCRQVFRGASENYCELGACTLEVVDFDEGTPERHAGGQITGMNRKPGAARCDRLLIIARSPIFLGKLRKRNRRRILLDPASKLLDPRVL